MHIKNINELLNSQYINVVKISKVYENTVEITLEPLTHRQSCPSCNKNNVIRKGLLNYRKVKYLYLYGDKTILFIFKIRLYSKVHFVNIFDEKTLLLSINVVFYSG